MKSSHVQRLSDESLAWVEAMDGHGTIGHVVSGTADHRTYVRFLRATYHYVRLSGALLARTALGLRRSRRCPFLIDLLEHKTREEATHDVWVLEDLSALGVRPEHVQTERPPRAVEAYLLWSASMADAGSPAFLGAAFALEFISMHRAGLAASNLRERAEIPNVRSAVRFLEGHGEADLAHVGVLEKALEQVQDARDQRDIQLSAGVLRTLYPLFFEVAR